MLCNNIAKLRSSFSTYIKIMLRNNVTEFKFLVLSDSSPAYTKYKEKKFFRHRFYKQI